MTRYDKVVCKRFLIDRDAEEIEIGFPIYNLDKAPQLYYKLSTALKTIPEDLFIAIRQGDFVFIPHQYKIGKILISIETPERLVEIFRQQDPRYKRIGNIPVMKQLVDIYNDGIVEVSANMDIAFLGDYFSNSIELEIQIISYEDILNTKGIGELLQNIQEIPILNYLFLNKYFPAKTGVFQRQSIGADFFRAEENFLIKYTQERPKHVMLEKLRYNASFKGILFDLRLLFDVINVAEEKSFFYLQYCYIEDGIQKVITKRAKKDIPAPYLQFYEPVVNGRGQDFSFQIYENASILFTLYINKRFDHTLDFVDLKDQYKQQLLAFLQLLQKYNYMFVMGTMDISQITLKVETNLSVVYTALNKPGKIQLKLEDYLRTSPLLFTYVTAFDRYRTNLIFNEDIQIKTRSVVDALYFDYYGVFHESALLLTDTLIDQLVQTTA